MNLRVQRFFYCAFFSISAQIHAKNCVYSLRDYFASLSERSTPNIPPEPTETGPTSKDRKSIEKAIEGEKAATRAHNVSLLGQVGVLETYFEFVDATVKGESLGKVPKLKKVQTLIDDTLDVLNDLRKLLKNEDAKDVPIAAAYTHLISDFLDYYEDTNPSWIEKKVKLYRGFIKEDTTLFDLLDVMIHQHARDRGLLETGTISEDWTVKNFLWKLLKVSPSSRKFIISETKKYYRKRAIALTTGLPATLAYQGIPAAIALGIPAFFIYLSHQGNTEAVVEEKIQAKEEENLLKITQAQKDELKRSIQILKNYNSTFEHMQKTSSSAPGDIWKIFNDSYSDISKLFAKLSGADRLSLDPTTRGVVDSFIKEVSKEVKDINPKDSSSLSHVFGRQLATQSLLLSLLNGAEITKEDYKKTTDKIDNFVEFNSGFVEEAKHIVLILETAIEQIPVTAETKQL